MTFNIKSKAISDATFLHLRDVATDEKLYDEKDQPIGIDMYGKASKQYRQALSQSTSAQKQTPIV
jgi:hypothetical protein